MVCFINVSSNWILSWLVNFSDLKVIQGCHELNKLPNYDISELLNLVKSSSNFCNKLRNWPVLSVKVMQGCQHLLQVRTWFPSCYSWSASRGNHLSGLSARLFRLFSVCLRNKRNLHFFGWLWLTYFLGVLGFDFVLGIFQPNAVEAVAKKRDLQFVPLIT